ncbi:MAG: AI-2E family transporter [Phycisphaerales bacterium JB064]
MREASETGSEREHESPPDLTRLGKMLGGPLDVRSIMLTGLFVLAVIAAVYVAKPILVPMVLAILLAIMLGPVVRWLRWSLRIPSPLGAAVVLLVVVGGFGVAAYFLSEPATVWLQDMPSEMREMERKFRGFRERVEGLRQASEQVEAITKPSEDDAVEVRVSKATITPFLLGQTWYIGANAFLTLGLLYFLLAADDLFLVKLVRVIPKFENKKLAVEVVHQVHHDVALYFVTITLINAGLGVAIGTAMWLLGVPNPLLWGIAAAVLNFIPFAGAIVGVLAVSVVAAANFEHVGQILLVPAVYYTLTTAEGSFITPMILGKRLVLNPVVIFLSIMLWGWMWGIPGIFLAVPIMSAIKITCDNIEPLRVVGEFLGR